MSSSKPPIDEIFIAALEKNSEAEVQQYLDEVCGEDENLRQRVDKLREAHRNADSNFLETPATGLESKLNIEPQGATEDSEPLEPDKTLASPPPKEASPGKTVLESLKQQIGKILPAITLHDSADDAIVEHTNSSELPSQSNLGRYQFHGEIARGGMGAILKGRDSDIGRDVAVKVLLDDHKQKTEYIERFVEEAQVGGQLQHPGIVPVYELGQFEDQRPFFTMKLVKGQTLAELLAKRSSPQEELPKMLGIFEQICQTMAYAHSKGVIHRDLKPANVMVGSFGEVQVMDWGLSKVLSVGGIADEKKSLRKHLDDTVIKTHRSADGASADSDTVDGVGSKTRYGSVMGTPAYMPPEQARGEVEQLDERADVFGLGAILAEVLSGRPPYVADSASETFRLAIQGDLTECIRGIEAEKVDLELQEIAEKALAPNYAERYRNSGALCESVTGYIQGVQEKLRATELARLEAETRSNEERKRKKLYLAIALLIMVAAGVGLTAFSVQAKLRQQKALAKQLESTSVLTEMLAQARKLQSNNPTLSTLFASEALTRAKSLQADNERLISFAHSGLLESVVNLGGTPIQDEGKFFSVSGNRLLIGPNEEGAFRILDYSKEEITESSVALKGASSLISAQLVAEGEKLAVADLNEVRIWDLSKKGRVLADPTKFSGFKKLHTASPFAVSRDGKRVITVAIGENTEQARTPDDARRVFVIQGWDIESNDVRPIFEDKIVLKRLVGVSLSADGGLAVVNGEYDLGDYRVGLWNLRAENPAETPQVWSGRNKTRPPVSLSSDSNWLAIGLEDGARLFDLRISKLLDKETCLSNRHVRSLAFSSDGKWVACGASEGTQVFDLSAGPPSSPTLSLFTNEGACRAVSFSTDKRWIATGHMNKSVCIWDVDSLAPDATTKSLEQVATYEWHMDVARQAGVAHVLRGHAARIGGVNFLANTRTLVSEGEGQYGGKIRVWNIDHQSPASTFTLSGHGDHVLAVAYSPDGRWLASGAEDGTAFLWDLASKHPGKAPIQLVGDLLHMRSMVFSADGRWLAASDGYAMYRAGSSSAKIYVGDLYSDDIAASKKVFEDTAELKEANGQAGNLIIMQIDPTSCRVAAHYFDGIARVWELSGPSSQTPTRLPGHLRLQTALRFTPDGERILTAAGTKETTIRLWGLNTSKNPKPTVVHKVNGYVYTISADVYPHVSSGMALWRLDTDKWQAYEPRLFHPALWTLGPSLLSPEGRFLAKNRFPNAREKGTFFWDLSKSEIGWDNYVCRHQPSSCMAFSPSGNLFASGGEEVTEVSRIDPSESAHLLVRINSGELGLKGIGSIAFSPDETWLATGCGDGTVRLWDLNSDRLLQEAASLAGRALQEGELQRYLFSGIASDSKWQLPDVDPDFVTGQARLLRSDAKTPDEVSRILPPQRQ